MKTNIQEELINYKQGRASKYIPVRGDEIKTRIFDLEKYYLSTKIDGNLCFIIKNKQEISVVNFNNVSFGRDELVSDISNILKNDNGIFVGEIYLHEKDKRTRSYDLKKALGNPKTDIRIAMFDILEYNNQILEEKDWSKKKDLLKKIFTGEKIYYLDELELSSRKDIETEFNSRVQDLNEEGVVVRGESGPIFKVKEYLSFDLVVLGYVLGFANDFSLMKEILVGVKLDDNNFLEVGIIANGFSSSEREKLAKDFEKMKVKSNAIQVSHSKLSFTMIKPELIVEVESTDIINSTSQGVIKKSILRYDNEYFLENKSPSISLTTPVFVRFRSDKNVDTHDVGLSQITRILDLCETDDKSIDKKPSKIIKKEIYVKEMKGIKMVKKFFVWDTNTVSKIYPNFVFYKVDYSPTRAVKMKRDIKVSDDKNQIVNIFKNEIETDIKKGWSKI